MSPSACVWSTPATKASASRTPQADLSDLGSPSATTRIPCGAKFPFALPDRAG